MTVMTSRFLVRYSPTMVIVKAASRYPNQCRSGMSTVDVLCENDPNFYQACATKGSLDAKFFEVHTNSEIISGEQNINRINLWHSFSKGH